MSVRNTRKFVAAEAVDIIAANVTVVDFSWFDFYCLFTNTFEVSKQTYTNIKSIPLYTMDFYKTSIFLSYTFDTLMTYNYLTTS